MSQGTITLAVDKFERLIDDACKAVTLRRQRDLLAELAKDLAEGVLKRSLAELTLAESHQTVMREALLHVGVAEYVAESEHCLLELEE